LACQTYATTGLVSDIFRSDINGLLHYHSRVGTGTVCQNPEIAGFPGRDYVARMNRATAILPFGFCSPWRWLSFST